MAESKLDEIIRTRQFPGLAGLSDGRGSAANEIVFDRPDVEKETRITLQRMEADGKLNDPQTRKWAEVVMEGARKRPKEKLDYQKGDHPFDD